MIRAAVAVFALFGVASCRNWQESVEWRHAQEVEIAAAVLVDLAEMPPDKLPPTDLYAADVRTAFCVYVEPSASDDVDPPAAVLETLRTKGIDAYPLSQCDTWRVSSTGAKATYLTVSSIEWKSNDLAKAEGARLLGSLRGNSWRYTLSKTDEGWKVDTVRMDRVF